MQDRYSSFVFVPRESGHIFESAARSHAKSIATRKPFSDFFDVGKGVGDPTFGYSGGFAPDPS